MEKEKRYAAVIIETRPLENLKEILWDNHASKLPDNWDIIIIGQKRENHFSSPTYLLSINYPETIISYDFVSSINGKKCEGDLSSEDYNLILTDPDFWHSLSRYDRVLIFQHDSKILKRDDEKLQSFLKCDYVGAAWSFQYHGGNGGLSIRNPKAMLHIIKNRPYRYPQDGNEDVYFSNELFNIEGDNSGYYLADRNTCKEFSCESIFALGTFGVHAIDKYLTPEQCNQILNQYKDDKMETHQLAFSQAIISIQEKFNHVSHTPSDINEHLEILMEYAGKCDHVTEMGVRDCVATWAFMMAHPKVYIGVDLYESSEIQKIKPLAEAIRIDFNFLKSDTLSIEIEETDFLFIDTYHTASQLEKELTLHANKVRKFIAFHDVESFGEVGEAPYTLSREGAMTTQENVACGKGLNYAINPFLEAHPEWKEVYRTDKNNGLLIIGRI